MAATLIRFDGRDSHDPLYMPSSQRLLIVIADGRSYGAESIGAMLRVTDSGGKLG